MRLARALVLSAGVYAFVQHTGTRLTWLGAVPVAGVVTRTRWADWIDIVTPYALLSAGAWVLHVGVARPRQWVLYFLGATSYCIGQRVHVAANSISNDGTGVVLLVPGRRHPGPRCPPGSPSRDRDGVGD